MLAGSSWSRTLVRVLTGGVVAFVFFVEKELCWTGWQARSRDLSEELVATSCSLLEQALASSEKWCTLHALSLVENGTTSDNAATFFYHFCLRFVPHDSCF
jgi:hypothetical protein